MQVKVWRRSIERIAMGALLAATMSGLSLFPQMRAEGRPLGPSSGGPAVPWMPRNQPGQQVESGSRPPGSAVIAVGMRSVDPNQIRKDMQAAGMDVTSPGAARAIRNIAELGIW